METDWPGWCLCLGAALAASCVLLAGCDGVPSDKVQGYVEGEYLYVASPVAGALQSLKVQRGMQVNAGDLLFALESGSEKAARDEAARRLAQSQANLEDAKKGKRPTEIDSADAQLKQAQAALVLSQKEFERQERLIGTGATSAQDHYQARSARDQDRERVTQLDADLQTAKLGSRIDQVAAAQAFVRVNAASLAKAQWDLDQKTQKTPKSALVFDTLYREGEWIDAGHPVVSLLPPEQIKVRAFVPETHIGAIHIGDPARVNVDGVSAPFEGKVNFISPQAEYTPPVIYSRESRSKLVFMVEVVFDPKIAANLHPGQPVDVQFGH